MNGQVVDPEVSQKKVNREIDEWRQQSPQHTKRGIFLLEALFPKVFVVFAVPHIAPPAVVFGVELDFTNYDLWPPSVRFVNPFTREAYRPGGLPTRFLRFQQIQGPNGPSVTGSDAVIFQGDVGEAFMCTPGVREYHNHPAHDGDSWLLHRGSGEGTLFEILDKLHEFGIAPIVAPNLALQIQFGGYQYGKR